MDTGPRRHRSLDLSFGPDFLTATRDDGERIRFSRLERALLAALSARPGRIVTRERLLALMNAEPEDLSDRNVDFAVNRLRKKLGDSARAPRFIATQYGEGYVWIAPLEDAPAADGFMVIGPVRRPADPALAARFDGLIGRLRASLAASLKPGRRIAVDADWRPGAQPGFRFSLEATLVLPEGGEAEAALVLRDEPSRRVLAIERLHAADALDEAAMRAFAVRLIAKLWRSLALTPAAEVLPTDPPLHLRMQGAAMLLSGSRETWLEMERRIAEHAAAAPEDAGLAIMRGVIQYARLVFRAGGDPADPATYRRAADAIEPLVLGALPRITADPVLSAAAAKLLLLMGRGHEALAERLAETVLATSAAFAATLPVLAQCKAWRGDLEGAIADYDQALELADRGSEFEVYLLVLKSYALLARGDYAGALALFARLVEIKPSTLSELGLHYLPPEGLAPSAEQRRLLAAADAKTAREVIGYHFHMGAKFFGRPEHAARVMRGPFERLTARFGVETAPAEVRRLFAGR